MISCTLQLTPTVICSTQHCQQSRAQVNRASGNHARRTNDTHLPALQVWRSPGLQEASIVILHCSPDATGGSARGAVSRFCRSACQLRWRCATATQYSKRSRIGAHDVSGCNSSLIRDLRDPRPAVESVCIEESSWQTGACQVRRNADIVVQRFGHHFYCLATGKRRWGMHSGLTLWLLSSSTVILPWTATTSSSTSVPNIICGESRIPLGVHRFCIRLTKKTPHAAERMSDSATRCSPVRKRERCKFEGKKNKADFEEAPRAQHEHRQEVQRHRARRKVVDLHQFHQSLGFRPSEGFQISSRCHPNVTTPGPGGRYHWDPQHPSCCPLYV
jgi:hypothetical protein